MPWSCDRTLEVVFWGAVSALLAGLLHALGLLSCWVAFPPAWALSAGAAIALSNITVSPSGKAVVVTGCDSGFGHSFALILDKLGFRVFAGCLQADGEGAEHLRQEGSSRLHVLQMDVTSQDQLDKAAQEVKRLLPHGEGVWGLVNNAGVLSICPAEWSSMDGFRRDPEINVFGLIAATKAFLPLVRRARGRVVNVASICGRFGFIYMSAYTASKYAVEGFSDSLRQEMRGFGVKVCIIEPGNYAAGTRLFRTDEAAQEKVEAMLATASEEVKQEYGKEYPKRVEDFVRKMHREGGKDINPVINAFTEALTQTYPQNRYCPMNAYTYMIVFVNTHFPSWLYDTLFGG